MKKGRSVEKRYSLFGFIIIESKRGLQWIQHVGDWHETGQMMYVTGVAYLLKDYDVLLIGRAKAMKADRDLNTFEEVEKYLALSGEYILTHLLIM